VTVKRELDEIVRVTSTTAVIAAQGAHLNPQIEIRDGENQPLGRVLDYRSGAEPS
jgi:hypothetical protein